MTTPNDCRHCNGSGEVPKLKWFTSCTVCDGTGKARVPHASHRIAASDAKAEHAARMAARDAARAEQASEKADAPPKPACERCRGPLYKTNVSGICTACQRKCKTCGGTKAANLTTVNCIDCAAKARSAAMRRGSEGSPEPGGEGKRARQVLLRPNKYE